MDGLKNRQLRADLLLLVITAIWGGTFVMVKGAVSAYPVFPFLTLRFGLAVLALLPLGWRGLRSLDWRGLGSGALIGLFLFAGYAFQTVGLQYTSASKAGFITGLSVVMVPLISALWLRRLPHLRSVMGVLAATIGLALLSLSGHFSLAKGDLYVLLCALSFALHIVSVGAFAPKADPLGLTLVQVSTVALASAIVSLFTHLPWPSPTPQTWAAAGFTGVLATAVAFAVQTTMQRFTTPTHTALIFTAEPLFAALFAVFFAGDSLTTRSIVGGALIIAGTIISEIRWSKATATYVSRFLSPHYVIVPSVLVLGLADPGSWRRGLFWAVGIGLPAIAGTLLLWARELRRGGISDWHISDRRERLHAMPIIISLVATALPLSILIVFDGPALLVALTLSAFALVILNLLITLRWKVSQHVSSIAATSTLIAAALGMSATPLFLLIPLVAWARVKVGAHTVMQTVVGGIVGVTITFATLRFLGIA